MDAQKHFISVEGTEGVGKSTAVQFIKSWLEQQQLPFILTREPGGTPIAEQIRQVLLTDQGEPLARETELLLMFASRAQHVAQVIKPALAQQNWVVCDRFVDASYAYQGGGRQIDLQRIKTLDQWVLQGFKPGLTLLLDAPIDICLERMRKRGKLDRIELETQEFFTRVKQVYLARAAQEPQRFRLIDASGDITQVQQQIARVLTDYIK